MTKKNVEFYRGKFCYSRSVGEPLYKVLLLSFNLPSINISFCIFCFINFTQVYMLVRCCHFSSFYGFIQFPVFRVITSIQQYITAVQ